MKTKLLVLFAIVMMPIMTESFAEELEIKFGQTIFYDNLKLYFYDVEDSRCPSDVTCIWEGKVSTMIYISNQTHKIVGPVDLDLPLMYFVPYEITLIDVKQYTTSTEKFDYVAILEITKSEDRSTDFRETNADNSLLIVTIQSIGAILIVLFIILYAIKKRMTKNIDKQ